MLDLKNSHNRTALFLEKITPTKILTGVLFSILATVIVLTGLWLSGEKLISADLALGWALLLAGVGFAIWVHFLFLNGYLKISQIGPDAETNLADWLDFEAAQLVEDYLRYGYTNLSGLLEPIAKKHGFEFIMYRIGIQPPRFRDDLNNYLSSLPQKNHEDLESFLEDALRENSEAGATRPLDWRDLLVPLCSHSDFLRNLIFEIHLEKKDIRLLADWERDLEARREARRSFWRKENLMRGKGIGKDWASGYTLRLDRYAADLTASMQKSGFAPHLYGRKQETEAIEQILARSGKNNVVVVGEAGVGKKTLVFALAKRILDGETLPSLAHKRVLELDVGSVLAGAKSEREVEERMLLLLNDTVRAGNVILMIDEIHTLFENNSSVGAVNAAELLLPYLNSSAIQIIGLTSYTGYHNTIAKNSSLLRAFEKVEVHEPDKKNVFQILQDVVPQIEAHDQVLILFQSMRHAVELTDRYIKNVPFPEKAISVLQQAAVMARTKRRSSLVTPEDVEQVVHQKTEIPIGKIALAEKEVLLDLEKILHRKVIGQEDAISAISNSMRRARSGISSEKKPIGSFLFLGPTGVGKTETAKALAESYFGSVARMVRFDMSEYQQADSIRRLIGYDDKTGLLTSEITDNPFSLLLLDEIEKAHPEILNLFLQVLDDGRLTDALGRTVDFTNTIIIATSNAGAELIRESIQQFREVNLKERLLDFLQKQGMFRPEFLNRFDAVIVFKPLTEDQTQSVVELLLADLNRRLLAKDVQLQVTPALSKRIAQIGYDPQFGARPLRRVIQDRIETLIATKLLSNEVKRGDIVAIKPEEI